MCTYTTSCFCQRVVSRSVDKCCQVFLHLLQGRNFHEAARLPACWMLKARSIEPSSFAFWVFGSWSRPLFNRQRRRLWSIVFRWKANPFSDWTGQIAYRREHLLLFSFFRSIKHCVLCTDFLYLLHRHCLENFIDGFERSHRGYWKSASSLRGSLAAWMRPWVYVYPFNHACLSSDFLIVLLLRCI